MGAGNFRQFKRSSGGSNTAAVTEEKAAAGKGPGAAAGKNNNKNTRTARKERTGTGTAAGTGTGTAGPGAGETEKKPAEVAILTPPEKNGAPKKRRNSKTQKKKDEAAAQAQQISAVIQSVSMIVATRPDCEQWVISEKEADSIAAPLYNLMSNSEAFAKLAEHSDALALCVACSTVFIPRVMVTVEKQKTKPKKMKIKEVKKIDANRTVTGKTDENRASNTNNRAGNGNTSAVRETVPSISAAIPAVVGGIV